MNDYPSISISLLPSMRNFILTVLVIFLATACSSVDQVQQNRADDEIHFTILQINDVYEITPVSGGREGGLSRVATIRKELMQETPNTYTVIAGDFFSPSALGTARVDGERLSGKQMVAVMNAMGLDFATFGNHEFDLKEAEFNDRMTESDFTWVSANVFDANGQAFPGAKKSATVTIRNAAGKSVRLGIFGVTLGSNPKDYVQYTDFYEAAKAEVASLRNQADVIVGLTHLDVEDDMRLAAEIPGINLIMGGHEHENIELRRGPNFVPVTKADANARSVYVHRFTYHADSGEVDLDSEWVIVNDEIGEDPGVAAVAHQWTELGFAGFRQDGFNPENVTAVTDVPLDGLEASVRNMPTALTDLIAQSLLQAVPEAELAFFNGGSIRIDDVIAPGPVTEYDVIRILPFGGKIMHVSLTGALLRQVVEQGLAGQGKGGYLHWANVKEGADGWYINGERLDDSRTYQAAMNDFLLTGLEEGMDFLTPENPGLKVLGESIDVRQALIDQLARTFN